MPSGPKIAGFGLWHTYPVPNFEKKLMAFAIAAFASSALLVQASFL